MKPFPREVAGAVESDGGDESKPSCLFFKAAQLDSEHLQEELPFLHVEGGSAVASECVGGHLHPSAGVAQARGQASLRGVGTKDPWSEEEDLGQYADGKAFLGL